MAAALLGPNQVSSRNSELEITKFRRAAKRSEGIKAEECRSEASCNGYDVKWVKSIAGFVDIHAGRFVYFQVVRASCASKLIGSSAYSVSPAKHG